MRARLGYSSDSRDTGDVEKERKGDEMRKVSSSRDFGRQRDTEYFVKNKDKWELASMVGEPLWLCGGAGQAEGGRVNAIIQARNDGGWTPWGRWIMDLF